MVVTGVYGREEWAQILRNPLRDFDCCVQTVEGLTESDLRSGFCALPGGWKGLNHAVLCN